ncbi:hypothetical protein DFO67_1334 [Modicisalibacter xianhensis]|uniref:Uncharacterized protein n=1 Tax=Modicisalibacter xianhensis TaxID=442341 RepID=A0A4R8FG84_9GAMM|nr:hypothetical protein DFO67_1334 [Halomonas xianhensis]
MGKATSTSATQLVEKNYKRPIHTFPSSTMRKLRMAGIAEHKTNEYLNEKFMSSSCVMFRRARTLLLCSVSMIALALLFVVI